MPGAVLFARVLPSNGPARVLSPITPRVLANAPLAAGTPLAPPVPAHDTRRTMMTCEPEFERRLMAGACLWLDAAILSGEGVIIVA